MDSIQEKAQRDQAKDIQSRLEAAVKGLALGSTEHKAAFQKTLDDITAAVPRSEDRRAVWDFSVERVRPVFAGDGVVTLRPVQAGDADFYVAVKAQYSMLYRIMIHMEKVNNESLFMENLCQPKSFYCIAEEAKKGTPVGYIGIKDTRADVWEIAVEFDGQFTHKDYGSRSIRLFLNELRRITGKVEFQALVETDNLSSQKCFEKLGAELIGLCDGPILKAEEEKRRFEDNNLNLIDDNMKEIAARLGVEPRKLLSHVLDYRMICPL